MDFSVVDHIASIATLIGFPLLVAGLLDLYRERALDIRNWRKWIGFLLLTGAAAAYVVDVSDRFGWIGSKAKEQQSGGRVTARLRVRYSPNSPTPEILRSENALKPASLQFAEDGVEPSDPKRIKWTLLMITFERPLTVSSLRVSFDGASLPNEIKAFNSHSAVILIQGSIGERIVDVEAY